MAKCLRGRAPWRRGISKGEGGIEVATGTTEPLGAMIKSEMVTWQNVIRIGNVKPD